MHNMNQTVFYMAIQKTQISIYLNFHQLFLMFSIFFNSLLCENDMELISLDFIGHTFKNVLLII